MIAIVIASLMAISFAGGLAIGCTILRDWLDWRGFYRAKRVEVVLPAAYTVREQRQLKRNRSDLSRALLKMRGVQ